MIPNQQRRNHGARGNLEGLNHEDANHEGEEDGDKNGLGILADHRLPAAGGPICLTPGRLVEQALRSRFGADGLRGHARSLVDLRWVRFHDQSPVTLRSARNASCGSSTRPTCFIRFLPSFCFAQSLRFRVMSPP